jgi:uncharacterized membrane protein
MIREHLTAQTMGGEADFRWRAAEVTRLEGFSDAVFAFALTLLVVSLEVPKTFPELMHAMRGFVAFGACFALLANVWYQHCRFFRRYALQSAYAVFLNSALLFFVLFYVYPLKFLFVGLFNGNGMFDAEEARTLFVIFGLGYAAVFMVFTLLYLHALGKREVLALNAIETMSTRQSLVNQAAMVIVGLVSAALAVTLPLQWVGLAGYFYFVNAAYFGIAESIFDRQKKALAASTSNPEAT